MSSLMTDAPPATGRGATGPPRSGEPAVSRRALRAWILSSLTAAAACLLYARTLFYEFVWDDRYLVVAPGSPANGPIEAVWTGVFPLGGGVYYRPLVLLTYWFENALFGVEPLVSHAAQVLLYGLSVAAVFWLARALIERESNVGGAARMAGPAAAAAVLFAIHPVHVETVAFVSARTDLLAGILTVAAVAAALGAASHAGRSRAGWAVLSGSSFFAALLCKESALTTPVLSWLALRTKPGRGTPSRTITPLLAQAFALGGYVVVRALAANFTRIGDLPWGQPSRLLAAFARNVELLFAPIRLRVYHRLPAGEEGAAMAVWGAVALGVVATLAIRAWRRSPFLACALLWIPVSLLPVSGILAIRGAPVAERFLFLPSVGVCLLAAAAVGGLRAGMPSEGRAVRIGKVLLLAVLVILTGRTLHRQPVYGSDLTLYERMVEEYPTLPLGHLGLGILHQEAGRPAVAVPHLEQAAELSPALAPLPHQQGEAHRWLGLAYLSLGRITEAIGQLENAASQRPADAQLLVNLGSAYLQATRLDEAERALRRALDLGPYLGEAEINLGMVLARRGAHEEALPHFHRGSELLPGQPDAHYNLGNAYARLNRDPEAAAAYRRALELAPAHEGARHNLEIVLGR
jgi:Tfp pilus assembly protein PilF